MKVRMMAISVSIANAAPLKIDLRTLAENVVTPSNMGCALYGEAQKQIGEIAVPGFPLTPRISVLTISAAASASRTPGRITLPHAT